MKNVKLSKEQIETEIKLLKRIDSLLSEEISYFRIWSSILQLVAFLDLTSFIYLQKLLLEQRRRIESSKSTTKTLLLKVVAMVGMVQKNSEPTVEEQQQLLWIETWHSRFDLLFTFCWILEGLRLALKKAKHHYIKNENLGQQQIENLHIMKLSWKGIVKSYFMFMTIFLVHVVLLPTKWMQGFMSRQYEPNHPIMSIITNPSMQICETKDCGNYSIPYLFFLYYMVPILKGFKGRALIMNLSRNFSKVYTPKYVLRNPITFKRRIVQIITTVKSVKRALPTYRVFRTIWDKFRKIIILNRQRYQAMKQRKIQRILWKRMTDEERRLKATLRIQSSFRKMQAKQKVSIMIKQRRESSRLHLERVARGDMMKRIESNKALDLQANEYSILKANSNNWNRERVQVLRSIERELRDSVRFRRQVMAIIKPTSKYCTIWHSMVFGCIILENTSTILELLRFEKTHQLIQNFILSKGNSYLLMILNVIYLLDVLVDFFTGRFNENGELIPESFTARWIPLILKWLGNPITASFVRATLDLCFVLAGPCRVSRWLLVFIIPFGNKLLSMIIWTWFGFVQVCNNSHYLNTEEYRGRGEHARVIRGY